MEAERLGGKTLQVTGWQQQRPDEKGETIRTSRDPQRRSLSPRGSLSCLTRAEGTEVTCHFLPPQQLLCLDEQTVLLRKRVAIVSSKPSGP